MHPPGCPASVAPDGISFNSNTPINPTPGHASAGEAGINPNGRTLGEPGAAYGAGDGTRLTFGSGPGGALTCMSGAATTLYDGVMARGGGIIVLLVGNTVTVASTGSISATPPDATRDVAFAGGTIFVRAGELSVGDGLVTARGSVGRSVNTSPPLTETNRASEGYIVFETSGTVTGTTDPAANVVTP